jgi:hypothetical protein
MENVAAFPVELRAYHLHPQRLLRGFERELIFGTSLVFAKGRGISPEIEGPGGLWLCPRPFKIREVSKVPFATISDLQVVPHIVACTKQRPDALVRTSCYQTKR